MIDGLKPYPKMKDSGVPWLAEVPEHWTTLPLKRWVTMNRAVLPETTPADYEFRYLDIGSVGTGVLTSRPQRVRFSAAPSRARRVVRSGDTIVSTVRTYLKAIYFVDDDADELVCSTGFAVLTPRSGTEPKFVSYLCQSAAFTAMVTADSVGIAYPAIAEIRLGAFHVVVPPLPEQAAIVRFLDHADRRIRRYLRAKQKLIKLLEELKAAIIHRAVTGQIDVRTGKPYPAYKRSGVEWLGDVPEHWEAARVKNCVHLNPARAESRNYLSPDSLVTFLPMERVGTDGRVDVSLQVAASEVWKGFTYFRKNDVLVAKITPCFENGKGACLENLPTEFGFGSTEFHVLRARQSLDPVFLYRLTTLPDFRRLGTEAMAGAAGQQRVPEQFIADFVAPLPPLPEQVAIVRFLETFTHRLLNAIDRARREIDLLREFRTRLIADVVTGKLDVREAAARLPDEPPEADEPEPLDESEALGEASDDAAGDGLDPEPEEADA